VWCGRASPRLSLMPLPNEASARGGCASLQGYRGFPIPFVSHSTSKSGARDSVETAVASWGYHWPRSGCKWEGYYGDAAVTVQWVRSLQIWSAYSLQPRGIVHGHQEVSPGKHLSDISHAIQRYAETRGNSVVRAFVGTVLALHSMRNHRCRIWTTRPRTTLESRYGSSDRTMVNIGDADVEILDDGWTVRHRRWAAFRSFRAHGGNH